MPLTNDQAALSSMLNNYSYYLNPAIGDVPTLYSNPNNPKDFGMWGESGKVIGNLALPGLGGGIVNAAEGDYKNAMLSFLSGGFSDLLGAFGIGNKKKEPKFQSYIKDGMYIADPTKYNPVPLSGIPGAWVGPTAEYRDTANQVRMIQDLLPYYSQAIAGQKIPDAMAQLAADTATTGPRLALQQALQQKYGPIFDQLAAESNLRRSMANAGNDLAVLQGPGKQLIAQALEAAKMYDPEYFSSRAATGDAVNKLLESTTANLGKGLTDTERDEVGRSLALSNERGGTQSATSNLNTVGNAMAFGQAGRQRETESQNQLSKAIAASTAFLPTAKSNVDVFQVATGKPSYPQNDTRFNTNTATGDASGGAAGLLNTANSMWTTNQNNNLQKELAKGDWTDILSSVTGALGSVGGLVGLCWVAREVYGNESMKWLMFREWLLNKAPKWFYKLYAKHGEQVAKFISNKPSLKNIVRNWMNGKIESYAN